MDLCVRICFPMCFSEQVLIFLRFRVLFRVFRSRSLQKRSGTCLNASGVLFASKLHMEMGKTIGESIISKHFGILQLWEFFCQPFGENTFSKNATKTNNGNLKHIKFLSNQITARFSSYVANCKYYWHHIVAN